MVMQIANFQFGRMVMKIANFQLGRMVKRTVLYSVYTNSLTQ